MTVTKPGPAPGRIVTAYLEPSARRARRNADWRCRQPDSLFLPLPALARLGVPLSRAGLGQRFPEYGEDATVPRVCLGGAGPCTLCDCTLAMLFHDTVGAWRSDDRWPLATGPALDALASNSARLHHASVTEHRLIRFLESS